MAPSGQVDTVAEKIDQRVTSYVMELQMLGPDKLVAATSNSVYKITIR